MTVPPETDYSGPAPRREGAGARPVPLAARRVRARRHRRNRRVDVAIGGLAGVIVVLVVPGIALAAIGAVVALLLVGVSLLWRRVRNRRRAAAPLPRRRR